MHHRASILIVDDEPYNLDYLEQELEDFNCETRRATRGREALDAVREDAPDLVLLDIMMPEMDGFQVLEQLKDSSKLRDIPVIVISAMDDMESVARGIRMGAEDYLPKPFDHLLLRARVSACLERKRLRDQELVYLRRIQEELAWAWEVQSGFLPSTLPSIPGWQFSARIRPSRETSGDFYDLMPLPEGRLGMLIADVSDKGIGAALFMVLSRTLIRIHAAQGDEPARVLRTTNRHILSDIHTSQFVTLFYGILDPQTGSLIYSSAGHTPAYVIGVSAGHKLQTLPCTGMPLGILQDQAWQQRTVQLAKGDLLFAYTDGLTEAQGQEGKFFGVGRLIDVLQASAHRSASAIEHAVLAQLDEFTGGAVQSDDVAFVIAKRG
jgi:sigma-B regulation protein RsbU (phosphoserine phosphatase)